MKVNVDEEKCIGCGACESLAEDYFEVDQKSNVKKKDVAKEDEDKVKDAKDMCPVDAIKLT